MLQIAPAFWATYRGSIDPERPDLSTVYNYVFTYTIVGNAPVVIPFSVSGPAQLTKQNFVELKWSPIVGLIAVSVTKNGATIFQSNGAEQGFMDQGHVNSSTTGVQL